MKPTLFFVGLLVGACSCATSHGRDDAGRDGTTPDASENEVDAGRDPDAGPDAGMLPPVTPMTPACDELAPAEGRACVEHGWFALARWSTMNRYAGDPIADVFLPCQQPVFLETFLMDRTEVTVAAYQAYVSESGAEPPPEQCGYEDRLGYDIMPDYQWEWIPEVSGMVDRRADHPVVCVTRAEAAAFCAWRGGRLPTVAEWMRAGQAPYRSFRRFPWGDAPPPPDDSGWISANFEEFYAAYLVTSIGGRDVGTQPVGSRALGVSPTGVFDLAGNASELLAECAEQLEPTYGASSVPLVRPDAPLRSICEEAVLVGGTNWRSYHLVDAEGSQTIWSMTDGRDGFDTINDSLIVAHPYMWGEARPVAETVPSDGAGNERRSWRIGFRCVYDP